MKKKKSFKFRSYLAVCVAVIMACVLLSNIGLNSIIQNDYNSKIELDQWGDPKVSSQYSAEWLTNGDFSSISGWKNSTGGDTSDVNGTYSDGHANFVMLGDVGNFTSNLDETILNESGEWKVYNNPQLPVLPILLDSFGGNSYDPDRQSYGSDPTDGLWCGHDYDNNVGNGRVYNSPSIHFKRNYSIGEDLSDYQVTSVSLDVEINGTVCSERPQGGGIEVPGDEVGGGWEYEVYDFARFYVIVSDINEITKHEMAYYKTSKLGEDDHDYQIDGVWYDSLNETLLNVYDEDILIAFLTNVFETSGTEFTITMGIDIYCETNSDPDYDHWKSLSFKEFNFSFTYEKKMNRYSQVSWSQEGDQLNGTVYQIDEARLNFMYKSDQVWPTALSPNTEIRALINNRRHTEVIKLADVNGTWKEAKAGGFDVTSIVNTDENITVTIQVIIMDNFELNSTYTLSIDNVSLMIYYSHKTGTETDTDFEIYLKGIDETLSKATTAKIGETVNVTFIYKDTFDAFIDSATVTITIGADTKNFIEMSNYYYIIVNTSALSLGENFHTISASRITYESQEEQIKIEVFSLDTAIHLFLDQENKTIEKSVDVNYGENVNITVQYRNIEGAPSTHVNNATVVLTGTGTTLNLTENYAGEYYNVTINSEILGLGIIYLTVNAQKENYSTQNIVFKVEVSTRGTYIDRVFINNTQSQTFEVPWNDVFNITMSYNDTETNDYISNATVGIEGTSYLAALTEEVGNQLYRVAINSSELQIGINYLSITAQKVNYSIASKLITITVTERETEIEVYLNQTLGTVIEIKWNEELNITAIYSDSGTLINGATVSLKEGSTILYNFSKHPDFDIYNLTINTAALDIGVNALTVYAKLDNYSYSLQSIMIIVFERESNLITYINQTPSISIEIPYGELLNISAIYEDIDSGIFINGSLVSLKEGSTILYNFTKHPDFNIYNLTVNTADFGIAVKVLTIYAKADNYTASLESIIINVVERETSLITYLNQTSTLSIEIAYDELLNITAIYNDLTNGFVNGATISLKDGSTVLYNLIKNPNLDIYNLTVNTADFGLGVRALTIYAKKENYTVSLESITINVVERETTLITYLDQTPVVSIEIAFDELLNITAVYNDLTTGFVNGATVTLKDGSTVLHTLTKNPTLDIYNLTVNTADFGLGVRALTIYAKKDNYTVSLESITINVVERETTLITYLDQTPIVSIEIVYNELLNITAVYNDITTGFVNGATITLKEGSTVLYNLIKNPNLDIYNLTVNTADFGLGVRALTIYAKKDNYTVSLESITINIVERETLQEVYLNGNQTTTIEIAYDEILNISTKFSDKHGGFFLNDANVYLKEGSTVLYNFTELSLLEIYNLTINTKNLSLGLNVLTIECSLANHTISLETITVSIVARETYVEIFLNNDDKTSEKSISLSSGEILNITILYKDVLTGNFIDSATIQLIGENVSGPLDENSLPDHYNFTVDTASLEVGVSFLSILAQKANYESLSEVLTVIVAERKAKYELYLNNVSKTVEKSITLTVNMTLNITLFYKDFLENYTLANATITLTGGAISETFIENTSGNYYYTLIDSSDLNQGINFLNILAQRNNYESLAILLTISIEERPTDVIVLLDDLDITNAPSKKVPVNSFMNFTVIYTDNSTGAFVSAANVRLIGEGRNDTFTPHSGYYSLNISAEVLNRGVNFLTIYVQKNNYEPYSLIVTIEIIDKPSDWEIYLNTINKTQEKAIDLPIGTELNVTIRYLENLTRYLIQNATISVLGEGLSEELNEFSNYYSILINTSQLDIGIKLLTIIAEKDNYQTISGTLRINVQRIKTTILTTSGEPNVEVEVGTQAKLEIVLSNIDFNSTVTKAIVQYSWIYGSGVLEDIDGDGTYEVNLENAPPGTYTVTITAYAGDDYAFERYYITVTVNKPTTTGGDNTFFIIFLVTLILLICVAGYAVLYQKRLKIPKPIRKLRKYRRTLKRVKGVENIEIIGRKEAIDEIYDGFINKVSKSLKEKETTIEQTSLMADEVAFHAKN